MGDVNIAGQTANEQGKIEILNQMDAGRLRWAIPVESHLKRKYLVGRQPTVPLDQAPLPFWSVFARAAYATTMKSMAETHFAGKCFVKCAADKSTGRRNEKPYPAVVPVAGGAWDRRGGARATSISKLGLSKVEKCKHTKEEEGFKNKDKNGR